MNVALTRPERGTRPMNRRALIIEAATALFHERGYEHVGVSDIAEAVNVRPSALYRHFPGKQQLLMEVVRAGIEPIREAVSNVDLGDRRAATTALATLGLDHRHAQLIWQREGRNLSPDQQAVLGAEVRDLVDALGERIGGVRRDVGTREHDLIASAVLSAVFSAAFHQVRLPRGQHLALMADIAERILAAPVTALGPTAPEVAGLLPHSRREVILAEAMRQFASSGYASVSVEDIAGALGIAGPSVYNHFASKVDLLEIPLQRGAGSLMTQQAEVLASTADPATALRRLIASYIRFAFAHPPIVHLLITEIRNLPAAQQHAAAASQREYVAEWVHLLLQAHPDLPKPDATVRIRAVIAVINDAARVGRIRRARGGEDAVSAVSATVVGLDP